MQALLGFLFLVMFSCIRYGVFIIGVCTYVLPIKKCVKLQMSYLSTILVFLNLKVQYHIDDSLEDFCANLCIYYCSALRSLVGQVESIKWRLKVLKMLVAQSCPTLQPHGLQPPRLLCPWNSVVKNTGVGCHALLQGIFLTQRSNPRFMHYRQILYCLSQTEVRKKLIAVIDKNNRWAGY